MATERIIPGEIRIFLNHIYEFKKGVRNMVLYTMSREHEEFAIRRLKNQKISYMIQEVGTNKINLFFWQARMHGSHAAHHHSSLKPTDS